MKNLKTKELRTRVNKEFWEKYMLFCKKNKYVLSKRLRVLMEKDLRGEIRG